MNEEQVKAHLARMKRSGDPRAGKTLKIVSSPDVKSQGTAGIRNHKFGTVSGYSGEIRFDSGLEKKHYERLRELQQQGHVLMIMRQVPFHFKPDHRSSYRVDFMVFWSCGAITFDDPKGMKLRKFSENMQKMIREYPHVCVEMIGPKGERQPALAAMEPMRQIPAYYRNSPLIMEAEANTKQKTSN